MKYYLAIKRNKIVTHSTGWVNLENNMLSVRSQSQKLTYLTISFLLCPEYVSRSGRAVGFS